MRYLRQYYDTAFLLLLLWCILSENFSIVAITTGMLFTSLTILIVHLLFSDNDDVKNYRIPPRLFVLYIVVLFYQIVKSGLQVSKAVIIGNCNPKVVHVRTSVHNHWFQCLIANSITLTPGTVTIDKTDHDLEVLWLCPTTDDPQEMAEAICGPFERILKKGDFRK